MMKLALPHVLVGSGSGFGFTLVIDVIRPSDVQTEAMQRTSRVSSMFV